MDVLEDVTEYIYQSIFTALCCCYYGMLCTMSKINFPGFSNQLFSFTYYESSDTDQ